MARMPVFHTGNAGSIPAGAANIELWCSLANIPPLEGGDRWFKSSQLDQTRERSSTARAAVSKTARWRFKSFRSCQMPHKHKWTCGCLVNSWLPVRGRRVAP
jgi:hypothetical protein